MTRIASRGVLAALGLLIIPSILVAAPSSAGEVYPPMTPYCATYSDGSGGCEGSMAGFRASPGATDSAFFIIGSTGGFFYSAVGAARYSCNFNTSAPNFPLQLTALQGMSPNATWAVSWSASGQCTSVGVDQSSPYP